MKHRINISIDPINWVYARANKINLSQLLNDILREMRHKRDEEAKAIQRLAINPIKRGEIKKSGSVCGNRKPD